MHHWLPPPMGDAVELGLGAADEGEAATLLAWPWEWLSGASDSSGAEDDAAEDTGTAAAGADEAGAADDGAADDSTADDGAAEETGTADAGADDVVAASLVIGVELVYGQTKTSEVLVMVIVVSGCVYVPAA